jgi:UDP-N-acetylglucosamine 4-epimerase
LAAATDNPRAINQVYNVAVGEQTTLIVLFAELYRSLKLIYPDLPKVEPVYRDFRVGDLRNNRADIGKARRLLCYAPTHRLAEGIGKTMLWHSERLMAQTGESCELLDFKQG